MSNQKAFLLLNCKIINMKNISKEHLIFSKMKGVPGLNNYMEWDKTINLSQNKNISI